MHILADPDIPLPIHRDITASLSDCVHHMCLIRHVPLSERDQVFEVVGEKLAAYVYTPDVLPDDLAVLARKDVAVRITYIEDDRACGRDILLVTKQTTVRNERCSCTSAWSSHGWGAVDVRVQR